MEVARDITEHDFTFDESTMSVSLRAQRSDKSALAALEPYRQIPGDINIILPLSMLAHFRFHVSAVALGLRVALRLG